ncbi:MAG: GTP cyclohydrolase I FolE2, partial [Euryarchaeota archaeon]|nr:GTP cyclohydrolase I FolE2 [Euryarchaeota archaeon]
MALKDVQSLPPLRKFKLTRVGVRNMKKLIYIHRKGRVIPLIATISAYVDLPSTQKGVHMSRNIEVVNEIINLMPTEKFSGLEDVMEYIARKLLERHEYAKTA